jgi:hypothetical protein
VNQETLTESTTGKKSFMNYHFFDQISIELLFLLTVILMLLILESGYRFGLRAQKTPAKAQIAQVRALMGATLGLLAFMLAFTFSAAQTHFENRIHFQIDEAVVAKNSFMRLDLAGEPLRTRARELLLDYVDGRIELSSVVRQGRANELFPLLQRAEEIQLELWSLGMKNRLSIDDAVGGSPKSDEFMTSVLNLMDMHTYRAQAALVNRIPTIIWLTLYFTAVMSMIVVGYQAGLTSKRSPVATYSLALTFAAVMMLITDIDRPIQSLFEVDVAVMEQLAVFMRNEL